MFCRVEWKGRDQVWLNGIPDEAPGGMGVEAEHEEECEVVGVPEGFEALLADGGVRSAVHHNHDKKHEVTSNASWLSVMDLKGGLLSNL